MAGLGDRMGYWRRVAHMALASVLVWALGVVVSPAAQASAVRATLSVTSTWQTGFIAGFTITNMSATPLSDWRLEFDLPLGESISHAWNSSFMRYGTHYVITPANWNRVIAPFATAKGGFRGVLSGSYVAPANCVVNRQYRCA